MECTQSRLAIKGEKEIAKRKVLIDDTKEGSVSFYRRGMPDSNDYGTSRECEKVL